jgi:hypothetical protein
VAHHEYATEDVGNNPVDQQYRETPPGAAYEHTDASVWTIVKFGVWLAIAAVIIHVGLGFMYAMFIERAKTTEREFPMATSEPALPPAPRLQQFPRNEMYQLRLEEDQKLHSYGWVNKDAGTVRIPIDDAMRLTVQRGLQSRPDDPAQPREIPGLFASDPSSGRVMERRRQ